VGQRLNERYVVERLLGEGAMGMVFLAHDLAQRAPVALKVLNPALCGDTRARERMAREAGALGRIQHPAVVRIYEVFEHGGALVLALEYVPGSTLLERMQSQRASVGAAVELMLVVLGGVQAIADAGIVHRDLKPANILLTASGQPKIADLGVARDTRAQALTRTGTSLGTLGYMSPEQLRGARVGPASDIYACGILLYELLTGRLPFDADSDYALVQAQLAGTPNLAALGQVVHAPLVGVVARALAKQPEDRHASAAAFAHALASVSGFAGASASAHPVALEQVPARSVGMAHSAPLVEPVHAGGQAEAYSGPAPRSRAGRRRRSKKRSPTRSWYRSLRAWLPKGPLGGCLVVAFFALGVGLLALLVVMVLVVRTFWR
jgi:serine/threonine-protein kinase